MVNTCVNEVNHRLIVSRLPGRLGGISCWHWSWLVWKAGVCSVHKGEELAVKRTVGGEAEGGVTPPRGPSDHFLRSWALGRGSGLERTVPFSTLPWRMCKKDTFYKRGFMPFLGSLSSNLILKVRGVTSAYSRRLAQHTRTPFTELEGPQLAQGLCLASDSLPHSAVFPI